MKTNNGKENFAATAKDDFRAVEFFRTVKEQISRETAGMTFEQLKKYIDERLKNSQLHPAHH